MKKDTKHFRDLVGYERAFDAAMRIFQITKAFPPEEIISMLNSMELNAEKFCF